MIPKETWFKLNDRHAITEASLTPVFLIPTRSEADILAHLSSKRAELGAKAVNSEAVHLQLTGDVPSLDLPGVDWRIHSEIEDRKWKLAEGHQTFDVSYHFTALVAAGHRVVVGR